MAEWKFLHVKTLDSAVWCCCYVSTKSNHQHFKVFFQTVKRHKAHGWFQKPGDDMAMLALWSFLFLAVQYLHTFRCHCCTQYRNWYRSCNSCTYYYFTAKSCSSIYWQQKNAAIETIFFDAVAIPHPAIFHTNIIKNMPKCIFLPQGMFIYNQMNVKSCLWRKLCQINKWY